MKLKTKNLLRKKHFSQKDNKDVIIKVAKNKNEINISNLAEKNAKQALKQKLIQSDTNNNLIDELASKFNLNNSIELIEVYDNSHIQGVLTLVGSLICFGNEGFVKKRYRKFNIKDEKIKNDDYGMMKEVLFRRFSKAIKEKSGSLTLPDLIIIDGGKGQYSVSREVLNELGLHDLPILAVAKGKKRNAGEEKIYHKGKEFVLSRNNPLLFFIQRLRDEAQSKTVLQKRYIIIFTSKTMKIKIPNILTIGRIIIVPIFVFTFFLPGFFGDLIPFLFVIASFTDFLDGLLARLYKEESKLGELLDPIADKILIAAALILLVMNGTIKNYEVIAAIIILTREILISGLREFLANVSVKMPVSSLAKVKTFTQILAISILLTGESGNKLINFEDYNAQTIGIILLWFSAFLTLYTGYDYLVKGIDKALNEDRDK